MPMIAPAKVATSPKATRIVSCISPCGASSVPRYSRPIPAKVSAAAMMSCAIFSGDLFIRFRFLIPCGNDYFQFSSAKVQQKNEPTKKWGSVR